MNLPAYEKKPVPVSSPITSFGIVIDPKAALRNCEVGASFMVDKDIFRRRVMGFAQRMGISIKTRRDENGRYNIWRTE